MKDTIIQNYENEATRELQKRYNSLLPKILILDEDLRQEFEQNDFEIRCYQDDEYIEWILLENNIVKTVCKQKFRNCSYKCEYAHENVFECMHCNEVKNEKI